MKNQRKRQGAEEIAIGIIDSGATDVTEQQMKRWSDEDLWLEAWGLEWRVTGWHGTVEIEMVESEGY